MIYNQFEIIVTSRPDYNHLYCEVLIEGLTIAEVYNDPEYGRRVVLYSSKNSSIELDEFTAVLDFCSYYMKKSIPKNFIFEYKKMIQKKKQFAFGLYNSAILPNLLYILELNGHLVSDKNHLSDDFIDMQYLFERFVSLLEAGHLQNLPVEVIDELVHEIGIAELPLTEQQRAILERHASPSPPQNFSP